MPDGKPAGVRCLHLADDLRCGLWGDPRRPKVCDSLRAEPEMCGGGREAALAFLEALERATAPSPR